jgi:outer membrane protein assembly factor BamE
MTKSFRIAFLILAALLLSACIKTYKHDVQQGNIVDTDRLARLEIGMSKTDVQSLLGTAMVKDVFHPERWDYFYSLRKARKKDIEKRRLTLIFKDGRLAQIQGNIEATDDSSTSQTKTVIIDERPQKGGMIQRGWDKVTK